MLLEFLKEMLNSRLFHITNVQVEPHPNDAALVVSYNITGQLDQTTQPPVTSASKQLSRIVRIKNASRRTDVRKLADEVMNNCPMLIENRQTVLPDLLQALKVIRDRRDSSHRKATNSNGTANGLVDMRLSNRRSAATGTALSPPPTITPNGTAATSPASTEKLPPASMKNLSTYVDKMYDEIPHKIDGAAHILALARKQTNLEALINSDRFISALSRVLREDHSRSLELSNLLVGIFLCFAKYQHFHPVLQSVRIGSLTMEIMYEELERYEKWKTEMTERQQKQQHRGNVEALRKNFTLLRRRQEALLTSCMTMLLFLGYEELLVQQKMMKKQLVELLRRCMQRNSGELQLKCLKFLQIIALFKDNHDMILRANVLKTCVQILIRTTTNRVDETKKKYPPPSSTSSLSGRSSSGSGGSAGVSSSSAELQLAVLQVLHNLSFSYEFRRLLLRSDVVQMLVTMMLATKSKNKTNNAEIQRAALQLLYQLSLEDKARTQLLLTQPVLVVLYRNLTSFIKQPNNPTNNSSILTIGLLINLSSTPENVELLEVALLNELTGLADDDEDVSSNSTAKLSKSNNIFASLFEVAMSRNDWRVLKFINNMARNKSATCCQILTLACEQLARKVTASSLLLFTKRNATDKTAGRAKTAVGTKSMIDLPASAAAAAFGSPDMLAQSIESLSLVDYSTAFSTSSSKTTKTLDQFCSEFKLISFLADIVNLTTSLPDMILSAIHLTATLARDVTCAASILSTHLFTNILNVTLQLDNNSGTNKHDQLSRDEELSPTPEIIAETIYVVMQLACHSTCRAHLVHNRMLLGLLSLTTTTPDNNNNNNNFHRSGALDDTQQVAAAELSLADSVIQLLATDDTSIRDRIREEKFSSYNQGWLEAIQNRLFDANVQQSLTPGSDAYDYGVHDNDDDDDGFDDVELNASNNDEAPYGPGRVSKASGESLSHHHHLRGITNSADDLEDIVGGFVDDTDNNNNSMFYSNPDEWEESLGSEPLDMYDEGQEEEEDAEYDNDEEEEIHGQQPSVVDRQNKAANNMRPVSHARVNESVDEVNSMAPKRPPSRRTMRGGQRPPSARPQIV